MENLPYELFMMSTVSETLEEVRDNLDKVIEGLSLIVVDRPDGYSSLTHEKIFDLTYALKDLLIMRDSI